MQTPDPLLLTGVLGSIGFLLFILNQGARFLDRFKENPPVSATYMRADTCEKVHGHVEERLSRHDEQIAGLQRDMAVMAKTLDDQAEARASRIHSRIDAVRGELAKDIARVHDRVDGIPAQIVATLKNTGAIS